MNFLRNKVEKRVKELIKKTARSILKIAVSLTRKLHPEWQPRTWSNRELRKFAFLFQGDIINVSGWLDLDQEGGSYKDYFSNKRSYTVSNKDGDRGLSGVHGELYMDLTKEIRKEQCGAYDVVFNHTTLEHVADPRLAVSNLCKLSKDIVIVCAPFMQIEHWSTGSYSDYFRFTEAGLIELFKSNNFTVIYSSSNHNPVFPIYFFIIASKHPEIWKRGGRFQINAESNYLLGHMRDGATRKISDFTIME
jgi:hypothetical protein